VLIQDGPHPARELVPTLPGPVRAVLAGRATRVPHQTVTSGTERWQGQVHTSWDRIAAIVARAQREHPYEVPGVSARPIIDGNPDYLAWMMEETDPTGERAQAPVP
jgi:periplasmic divalent cation tolerance protein